MAAGVYGPGAQRCMEMLIKFGEAFGAEKLVPLASAHTMPEEPPELLHEMTEGLDKAGTFTTLHSLMSGFSPKSWQDMGLPEQFVETEMPLFKAREEVYRKIGFFQTYTCLPMLCGNVPGQGAFVSWIGSGAQLMVNSLLGARCNRDGTLLNLAASVTGSAPLRGLFLDENRYGEVLVRFDGLTPEEFGQVELGAVGYYVGKIAGSRNVVIDGLARGMDLDLIKYLMAPLSVSGSVSICHLVGITPEAKTLEMAMKRKDPAEVITVGPAQIQESLSQYEQDLADVDMALFGCPHCTVTEVQRLAELLQDRRLKGDKRLWIGMPHQHYALADRMGYAGTIEAAGGVFASACMATIPQAPIPEGVRKIATTSFKAAHYITRLTQNRVTVCIAPMEKCLDAVT